MQDDIGYSSIFPTSGAGFGGPIGATGATGPAQTATGPTGPTGSDSTYIQSIAVDENGSIEVVSSDDSSSVTGFLRGPTAIYAGLTALSIGGGIPLIKGVCGGITLDFYNIRAAGTLGVTNTQDGNVKITLTNVNSSGINDAIEGNRIVYIGVSNDTIYSSDLIPEVSTNANRKGSLNYSYVNFGGETAGKNVVADIRETIKTVGPIKIGERVVTLDTFYDYGGTDGITLDVSRATVYQVITPIGIKAFKHDPIPAGQVMSFTMVVDGEDVWNFPSDVIFDAESKPVFYPGVNILHLWKSSSDTIWRANFTARGFGISEINTPGSRGSCCYYDVDGTKHCDEYTTQTLCNEKNGTYAPFKSCFENPCLKNDTTEEYNGVCCSEGRCIPNIDPNFCQAINGYFIQGITCGEYGLYPDDDASNLSTEENISGLCYNKCKAPAICCKNGQCLGFLTQEHCEEILGGKTVAANSCVDASCCDHVNAPGACCIPDAQNNYTCNSVNTPFECISAGGFYMGRNSSCETVNCSCDVIETTNCFKCESGENGCFCVPELINSGTCEDYGYYSTETDCSNNCSQKTCYKCNGKVCEQITACNNCPSGYSEGTCVENITCQTKTCYKGCENCQCESQVVDADQPCPEGYENSNCDCTDFDCDRQVACFWCFPQINSSIFNFSPENSTAGGWNRFARRHMQAPYRAFAFVNSEVKTKLDSVSIDSANITLTLPELQNGIQRTAVTSTQTITIDGVSYELPYFVENLASINLNVDVGSLPMAPGNTEATPISVAGSYRCYYIGGYAHDTNPNGSTSNRDRCLDAFGYQNIDRQKCKLCDFIDPIEYQLPITPGAGEEYSIDTVEPYSYIMKNTETYVPFPPLWGRMTYSQESRFCRLAVFLRVTHNLRLMSEQMILEICHAARTGELKGFMHKIIQKYKSSYQGKTEVLNDMVSGMVAGLGNPQFVGNLQNGNTFRGCSPTLKYDPLYLGTYPTTSGEFTYGSALEWSYTDLFAQTNDGIYNDLGHHTCYNEAGLVDPLFYLDPDNFEPETTPPAWWAQGKGWIMPGYGFRVGGNGDGFVDIVNAGWGGEDTFKIASYVYPEKENSFVTNPDSQGSLLNLVGEIFFYKPEDEDVPDGSSLVTIPPPLSGSTNFTLADRLTIPESGTPRGIFGRNLRYNLDKFRTATVFYHEENGQLVQTMPFVPLQFNSNHVSVPIVYINGWYYPSADCRDNTGERCLGIGCACVCANAPACTVTPGCQGPDCTGTGSGNPQNWYVNTGLIGTSEDFTTSGFLPSTQAPIKDKTKSKNVLIADGICVNMLCPECELYESC